MVRAVSLPLGFGLCVSALLPFFSLPLFGWSVPAPAWNALGLSLLVLGGLHVLRALNLWGTPWAIRLLLPWTIYRWWVGPEVFREWAKATLVPVQSRLMGLNDALARVGIESVTVYDPASWQVILPGWGYWLAGRCLMLAVLVTLLDYVPRGRCPDCRSQVAAEDPCCHGCGRRFPEVPGCFQCGRTPRGGDRFCRSCGTALAREQAGG